MTNRTLWPLVCVALLCAGGCARTGSELTMWGRLASDEQYLYLVRTTERVRDDWLPFPERHAPKPVDETFEVFAIDLRNGGEARSTGVRRRETEVPSSAQEFDFIELSPQGAPHVVSRTEIAARLRADAAIDCAGALKYDEQDSRVLYFYCEDGATTYRLEPPYRSADKISHAAAAGLTSRSYDCTFASRLGDDRVFIRGVGRDLFELSRAPGSVAVPVPAESAVRGRELVGIASNLRIHETKDGSGALSLVLSEPDKADRVFVLPAEMGAYRSVTRGYLSRNDMVVWLLTDDYDAHVVLSLDLRSGRITRSVLPAARAGA
jgi:predicted Fe-S protein YdhL (DUF1289 family)